jgi:hypothetical protein
MDATPRNGFLAVVALVLTLGAAATGLTPWDILQRFDSWNVVKSQTGYLNSDLQLTAVSIDASANYLALIYVQHPDGAEAPDFSLHASSSSSSGSVELPLFLLDDPNLAMPGYQLLTHPIAGHELIEQLGGEGTDSMYVNLFAVAPAHGALREALMLIHRS